MTVVRFSQSRFSRFRTCDARRSALPSPESTSHQIFPKTRRAELESAVQFSPGVEYFHLPYKTVENCFDQHC